MQNHDHTPTNDESRTDTTAPDVPTSAGWREVYAQLRVPTTFFAESDASGRLPKPTLTEYMDTKSCPFCSWTGAANKLHQHLPTCSGTDRGEALADGGRQLPREGERRVDKGALGGANDDVLVVGVYPDTRADEHHIDEIDATVADVNDEYAPGAPVVAAVYLNELEKAGLLEGPLALVRDAVDAGEVDVYHFPAPRLAAAEPQEVNA